MAVMQWPKGSTYNNGGLHPTSLPMLVVAPADATIVLCVWHKIRDWALQDKGKEFSGVQCRKMI